MSRTVSCNCAKSANIDNFCSSHERLLGKSVIAMKNGVQRKGAIRNMVPTNTVQGSAVQGHAMQGHVAQRHVVQESMNQVSSKQRANIYRSNRQRGNMQSRSITRNKRGYDFGNFYDFSLDMGSNTDHAVRGVKKSDTELWNTEIVQADRIHTTPSSSSQTVHSHYSHACMKTLTHDTHINNASSHANQLYNSSLSSPCNSLCDSPHKTVHGISQTNCHYYSSRDQKLENAYGMTRFYSARSAAEQSTIDHTADIRPVYMYSTFAHSGSEGAVKVNNLHKQTHSAKKRIHTVKDMMILCVVAVVFAFMSVSVWGNMTAHNEHSAPAVTQVESYVVQPGDTLWSFAQKVKSHENIDAVIDSLVELNHLSSVQLQPGQRILIPQTT